MYPLQHCLFYLLSIELWKNYNSHSVYCCRKCLLNTINQGLVEIKIQMAAAIHYVSSNAIYWLKKPDDNGLINLTKANQRNLQYQQIYPRCILISMQIRFNIPVLQKQQIWQRNQQIKHWGSYVPLSFRQGTPQYLIPNYPFLVTQIAYQLILAALLFYDCYHSTSDVNLLAVTRLAALVVHLVIVRQLMMVDPGISSRGDPIINEVELSGFKNFCIECKCMQTEAVRHCGSCNVCIEGSYAHIGIMNMCITRKNIRLFVLFCVSMIVQTVLIV